MELSIKPDTIQDVHDFFDNLDQLDVPRDTPVDVRFQTLTVQVRP